MILKVFYLRWIERDQLTTYCVSQEVFDSIKIVAGISCEDRFVEFRDVFGNLRSGHLSGKSYSGVYQENCGKQI